jgi:DNA-binding CsgD family transcriptional regulator
VRLAQALASINRLDEARVVIEAVLAQELDPGLRAFAVITYSGVFMRVGDLETALQFAADQEALLPEPWSSDVRAQSAFLTMQAGRIAEARDLATSIDEMDSPRAAVVVGMTNVLAHAYSGRPLDGIEIAAKWRVRHAELWQTEPLPADPSGALLTELMAKYAAGYFAEAEPLLRASYEQTLAGGPAQTLGPQTLAIGICALETGRLTEAIDWFRRSFDLMAAAGPNQYGDWAAAGMLTAAAQLRDLETVDEALAMLESFDATEFGMGRTNHLIALGWLHLVRGDTHAARTVLGGAVEDALDRGALTFAVDALHTLARTGLVDSIVADPDELAPRIQGPILEAKLEHTAGRIANDPERLERAAAGFDAIGARLYAAEALFDAARAHRRAGDQRAATVADRRAQALAAACPGARTPALHTTDEIVPLTDRERELALLAADGLSTKEIAERLFLSARTVQNHLNRAYEKLGVSGRRELRRALAIPDPDAPGAD